MPVGRGERTVLTRVPARCIVVYLLTDCLGTLAALCLAACMRSWIGNLPRPLASLLHELRIPFGVVGRGVDPRLLLTPQLLVLVAVIWPSFLLAFSVYDGHRNITPGAKIASVTKAVATSTLCLAGALYLTYREVPRLLFLLFFVLDMGLLHGARVLLWAYRRVHGAAQSRSPAVLVVGAGPAARTAAHELRRYAAADLHLAGYVDEGPAPRARELDGLPVLGTLADVPLLVATHKVQDALVALPLAAHEALVSVCRTLQGLGVRVHVVPDLFALSFPNAALDGFGGIPVIALGQPGLSGWQRRLKRAFDSAVAAALLVLLWPVLALIAVLIRLDSPGPAIYRQERVGENGRHFTMFKFRSMLDGADPVVHRAYVIRLITENIALDEGGSGNGSLKMEQDNRVTRVGGWLRRTSLDELPQLVNVLRGEMSLVGPRPPLPYEVAVYQDWHRRRLQAIPGITGLWQVEARNRVSFDEMVRLDIRYIERQSLWLDIRILLQTPLAALKGRGAG